MGPMKPRRALSRAVKYLIVTATLAALVGCGGAASRFESHMNRGKAYFDKRDFLHANIEFRNAMQISPKDDRARLMAARTSEAIGQIGPAAAMYQAIIDSSPENVEARASLGRILLFAGYPQRALDTVEPGLAKHPDAPSLLTVRSGARMQLDDKAGAAADADRALTLAPLNEEALGLRVGLYEAMGERAKAIALLSDALKRLPESPDLRDVLVNLDLAAGDPAKAEEQLHTLIKLRPRALRYRRALALYYAADHRLDDAQRELEAAVAAIPNSNEPKLMLVDFMVTQRTRDQGETLLRSYVQKAPDNYELQLSLGSFLQYSGKTREALDAYGKVVQRDGTGPMGLMARDRIAAIYAEQGRKADARTLLGEVLQKNPRDDDALTLRAEMALADHDASAAISDLRAVLRDRPRSTRTQQMLANAYISNGQTALAEQGLRAAIDVNPGEIQLRTQLAQLLMGAGHVDQAIPILLEAIQQAPQDPAPRELLAHAYLNNHDLAAAAKVATDLKTLLPSAGTGWYLAGLAAEGAGQLDQAKAELEHALGQQPRQAIDVLTALVKLDIRRKQPDQAITLLRSVLNQDPKNALVANLLGETYLSQKQFNEAAASLNTAVALAPAWWVPYHNLALAKLAAGDGSGAVSTYESGIKASQEGRLVTELARCYEKQGRVDDAIASYESWYRRNPHERTVANNLAMLLVTYKSDRGSLDRAKELVAGFASSDDGILLDTNGWVHFKRAEYSEALPTLEKAVERSPGSTEIRYHLGMAEMLTGRHDRARSDLEAAVSGSANAPWSQEARTALATLKARSG